MIPLPLLAFEEPKPVMPQFALGAAATFGWPLLFRNAPVGGAEKIDLARPRFKTALRR